MTLEKIINIVEESKKVLNGKEDKVKLVLCNILSNGHTLIEDAPGVGKTTLVKFLGKVLDLNVSRIQFTNDILPSDILGTSIFNKNNSEFDFHKGPIFGELILADELNRAPPKTQSALLQAMEERIISIEGKTFTLPKYFNVIATQNPHIQIGTFDLPESQLDRFSMKIDMGYPAKDSTLELLKETNHETKMDKIQAITNPNELIQLQEVIKKIHVDDSLYETIYQLLNYSRISTDIIPLSNRCGLDLVRAIKSWAFLNNRDYALPDDIFYMFPYIAGHRLVHPENSDINFERKLANQVIENSK
jgi:MoxR-like ATPase